MLTQCNATPPQTALAAHHLGEPGSTARKFRTALCSNAARCATVVNLFAWTGFPTATVEYARAERAAGETKWNYWKLWNFALDGLTATRKLEVGDERKI